MTSALRILSLALVLTAGVVRAEGLYREDLYRPLTADLKAFRVGDALTVQIVENSSASSTAQTSTQRNNGIDASLAIRNLGKPQGGHLDVGGTFSGGGTTQGANKVLAAVTVTVKETLPTGDLRVSGEQVVTVNEDSRKISVDGRVRPQDISGDNVVLSTRLADARIVYSGAGDVADRSRRAWWRVVLDWVGL